MRILPTSTVALAVDSDSRLFVKMSSLGRTGFRASADRGALQKPGGDGKRCFSKLKLSEASERQTCVCYGVVFGVDRATRTVRAGLHADQTGDRTAALTGGKG